jgi:lipoprotein-releasing system permease protein
MPYELFIALRHLRSKRKQAVISVITVIAVLAVTAGVASLIIVLSMMTGFREEFQAKILAGTAHLNLLRKDGRPIGDYRGLKLRLLEIPQVRAAAATFYLQVLIEGLQDSYGALLKGVDPDAPPEANEIFQFSVQGDPRSLFEAEVDPETGAALDRIIVGRELARALGLRVGDIATVISPRGHLTPLGMAPRYRDFRVAGIFESGLSEYDSNWAYISLDAARRLTGEEEIVELIQMKVSDIYQVKQIARRAVQVAGQDFAARDWQELNAPIYTALSYEKLFSAVAMLIVISIAALNIITVLVMIVLDKRRDIAILKSIGATNRSIMVTFMLEGLIIGALGIALGVAAGAGLAHLLGSRQMIKLPAGAYALSYLPFHTRASDVALVIAATALISFLSTLYPAWNAAKLDPVESLRYE